MESNQTQTSLQNDHISVDVQHQPNCVVELVIRVSPLATKASRAKAFKLVSKEISIQGFRPGKAPEHLIRQRYQKAIDEESKQVVGREALKEAMDLTKIYPLHREARVEMDVELEPSDEAATVRAKYEYFPIVPALQLDDFSYTEVKPAAIDQAALDAELKTVRRRMATLEPVTDRPAQFGDMVRFDIELINNKESEHRNNEETELSEEANSWLVKALVGLAVEDTKEVVPEGAPEGTLAKLTVRAINKPVLPELDEAFFKSVHAENLEDLTGKIRSVLEKNSKDKAHQEELEQIRQQLIERHPFDIPLTMLIVEFKDADFLKTLNNEGLEKAKEICKLNILSQRIAKDANIQISNEELRQAYYQQAMIAAMRGIQPENDQEAQALVDIAYRSLLTEKALEVLYTKAKKA